MHVAIARPVPARNNTAFEAQLDCYECLNRMEDIEVTVIADSDNELTTEEVRVIECDLGPRGELSYYAAKGLNKLTGRYDFISKDYPEIKSIIEREEFDVVETSDPLLYPYATTVANACSGSGPRLVCGSSVTNDIRTPVALSDARRVLQLADGIICPTPLAHDRYVEEGLLEPDDERVVYTGHPIDTERFKPTESSVEELTVVSVGRLEKRKGFEYLVKAVDQLHTNGIEFNWKIVGGGPLKEWIETETTKRGLSNKVTLHGVVDHDEIHTKYTESDFFLLHSVSTSSWQEYFGVVYAEAMSSGLPIVGSDSGAIPWVVRDGTDGILVPQRDTEGISNAIKTLYENPEQRKRMGKNGRENVCDRFSMNAVAEKMLQAWGS